MWGIGAASCWALIIWMLGLLVITDHILARPQSLSWNHHHLPSIAGEYSKRYTEVCRWEGIGNECSAKFFITTVGKGDSTFLEYETTLGIAIHPQNKEVYVAENNHGIQILNPDLTFPSRRVLDAWWALDSWRRSPAALFKSNICYVSYLFGHTYTPLTTTRIPPTNSINN